MKVKSKLTSALASIRDQLATMTKDATDGGHAILSDIEAAIARCTDHHDHPPDERNVNEILFLVSNAPGSITFLVRRLSEKIEASREPVVILKTLALLHRLLRGGDRFFEQDLRLLLSSGDLRINPHPCSNTFVISYSIFLQERVEWLINQSGKLEPVRPGELEQQAYGDKAVEWVLHKVSRCQVLLDRIMVCIQESRSLKQSQVSAFVINTMVRESIRVYDSFCESFDIVISSFSEIKKAARISALDILRKANIQTPKLQEFYGFCKRIVTGKNLEYPSLRVITAAEISSMEELEEASEDEELMKDIADKENQESQATKLQVYEDVSRSPFSRKLETKISTVWVEFDDGDSETSSFSVSGHDNRFRVGYYPSMEGESSRDNSKAMVLL
ncbi:hypothetical protein HPP92_015507 [Vanilla planifolia]|uniref:ENTH domain-containing protein n=1 Tax=Vanilla planifolia TaxID=51239 RepID=A0A835QD57_VANPL|nr:hypothetical protein HPP92_015507 [Vanilla planifolia]